MADDLRQCRGCQEWLPADAYYNNGNYVHRTCKQCANEYNRVRKATKRRERIPLRPDGYYALVDRRKHWIPGTQIMSMVEMAKLVKLRAIAPGARIEHSSGQMYTVRITDAGPRVVGVPE